MEKVTTVGVGPAGAYIFYELVERGKPLTVILFGKEAQAGVSIPYSDDDMTAQVLANTTGIEVPPIDLTYLQWPWQHDDAWLAARGLEQHTLHECQLSPRVILGEYYRDCFLYLIERARDTGFIVNVCEPCEAANVVIQPTGITIRADSTTEPVIVDLVAIVTDHLWPGKKRTSR